MGKRKMTTQTTWLLWMRKIFAELLKVTRNPISLPIVWFTPDVSFHTFYFFFLENNKEKILEILGRVSEKKKLDQLKMKYKELYDKVRIIRSAQRIYVSRAILFLEPAYPGLSQLFHSPSFWFWIQEIIEEVKPKLDEEMQMALECLGSGAEEDSKQLYEAMKVTSPCFQPFWYRKISIWLFIFFFLSLSGNRHWWRYLDRNIMHKIKCGKSFNFIFKIWKFVRLFHCRWFGQCNNYKNTDYCRWFGQCSATILITTLIVSKDRYLLMK
mgnify:CR=1 FL=1